MFEDLLTQLHGGGWFSLGVLVSDQFHCREQTSATDFTDTGQRLELFQTLLEICPYSRAILQKSAFKVEVKRGIRDRSTDRVTRVSLPMSQCRSIASSLRDSRVDLLGYQCRAHRGVA